MSKIVEMRDFVYKTLRTGAAKTEYYPCSQKTIKKVSKNFNDSNINLETLVASVDDTIFENCKKGLFITTYGIYISLNLYKPRFINFGEINNIKINSNEELIVNLIDGNKIIIPAIEFQFDIVNVYSVIMNLRNIYNKYEQECPYKKSKIVKKGKKIQYDKGYEDGFKASKEKFNEIKKDIDEQLKHKKIVIQKLIIELQKEKQKNEILMKELEKNIEEYKKLEKEYEYLNNINK